MQTSSLVIGINGLIGNALYHNLQQIGHLVIGSTRRKLMSESEIHLDLADPDTWRLPKGVRVAYVCAAISKYADCYADPEGSRLVNVTNTARLVRHLVNKGVFVVYLSSNAVFDGRLPYRKTSDPVEPQTEYGRQKAEAEGSISKLESHVSILRVAKVFPKHPQLLVNWSAQLRNGTAIHPFHDMTCAPVPLDMVCQCMILLGSSQRCGIWHLSGNCDVTYSDLALELARHLRLDRKLIEPESARSRQDAFEHIPRYTSLDCSRTQQEICIEPPSVCETVDWIAV